MNWTPCGEQMPENDPVLSKNGSKRAIKVLVAIKNRNGWTVRTQERWLDWNDKWGWRYSAGDVTHWMPLPEPPA